jgi:hypothetical protein
VVSDGTVTTDGLIVTRFGRIRIEWDQATLARVLAELQLERGQRAHPAGTSEAENDPTAGIVDPRITTSSTGGNQ